MFKGKKWFGDDGKIMALPDPIKESSTRPPLFHMEGDLDPALQTVYRKVRNAHTHFSPCTLELIQHLQIRVFSDSSCLKMEQKLTIGILVQHKGG